LRSGIGLSEGRHTGLQQDLRFGEVGGFGGQIGIANIGLGGRDVGVLRLSQIDGVIELILTATDNGLGGTEGGDGTGKSSDGGFG
jgi:hypothetical protein